jgi:hypothetical protein
MGLQVLDNRGFAALTGVLIFGGFCITIATSMVFSATRSMQSSLALRQSYEAKAIAEACAEVALQAVHDDTSYTGSGGISLGMGSCTYVVSDSGGDMRAVSVTATVDRVVRALTVETDQLSPAIQISSWSEM